MDVTINMKKIRNGTFLTNQDFPGILKIKWNRKPGCLYTLVIYNQSSRFLHEGTINIPKKTTILPYFPILPTLGKEYHIFRIEVYKHRTIIPVSYHYPRNNFPLEFFIDNYGLKKVYGRTFYLQG